MVYMRVFSDLKGVTEAMSTAMSRTLATGLVEGEGPESIARELVKNIDDIGKARARTIARTEVIRAHHVATINTYREAGIDGVTVTAEWSTAGDDKVCSVCEDMAVDEEGKPIVYTLDEIEPLIPAHPNCRCAAIPSEEMFGDLLKDIPEDDLSDSRAAKEEKAFEEDTADQDQVVEEDIEQIDEE
jgi:SPP1 gp7 family putative phage head morphogenesis protein